MLCMLAHIHGAARLIRHNTLPVFVPFPGAVDYPYSRQHHRHFDEHTYHSGARLKTRQHDLADRPVRS